VSGIVPLVGADTEELYGGKAVGLGDALRAGLPVPPGIALPGPADDAIACGEAGATAALRDAVRPLPLPLAVRSSAVDEDSAGASFAGQHATVLDVRGREAMHRAICHVWASGRSASARGYRTRMGMSEEPCMAVVVQQLVPADVAGVMFTQDPVTGADLRVIEASWGFGEAVVAGIVTPDQYRLTRQGAVLTRLAGHKDIAIRSLEGGGTQEQPVAPHLVSALCLGDTELAALQALAERCEAHHGAGPHDIEFAFSGGTLFLLQCRLVTRAGPR
jgi:pyruvate,water dikinase